jgi:Ca-activated chloride channel family protein
MRRILPLLASLWILGLSSLAMAQGVLVVIDPDQHVRLPRPIHWPHPVPPPTPQPEATYKIKELSIESRITDQVAKVQVSQSFVNTGSRQLEVSFVFPLPYEGAIDRMTLLVDGKEFPARLLPAKEARSIYESIVRKNRDPALLEWMGTGMFQTSVFPVPPGAERKVTLSFSQLCRKDRGLTDFLMPLSTAKYTAEPVETLNIQIAIESSEDIKNLYSPSHPVEIKRPDNRHAVVSIQRKNEIPAGDFRLLYDVGEGKVGASIVSYRPSGSEDGFFLLLASPEIKAADEKRLPKTVVLVVDRSGSMSGPKIEQAKNSLKFVLNNLREGDLFNIVSYEASVEAFRPELEKYSDDSRRAALGYVEGIYAGGGTNIDGALTTALSMLKDSSRANYVVFLTDGLPTVGEKNEMKIVTNARANNNVRARILSMGVGYDVNSRLLDRLVRENFGQSEYVRPDEDIEAHVSRLYNRIDAPVMTDLAVKWEFDQVRSEEGEPINRVLPNMIHDLFEGEQLVLVGRYRKSGNVKVTLTGSVGGNSQSYSFAAELAPASADETNGFVEKLWAMRRVGEIIDQLDLKGQNDELVQELVALSTKHGILTPYTSFLADETTQINDLAANARVAREHLVELEKAEGRGGFAQRAEKGRLQTAGQSGLPAPGGAGGAAGYRDSYDKEVSVTTCRNLGNKTFFCASDGRWFDSTVTEEMKKSAQRVEQFSDAYFKLAETHGRMMSQYLAFDEPLCVNLGGQAYYIDPVKN